MWTYNPGPRKLRGLQIPDQARLQSEFEINLVCTARPYLKTNEQQSHKLPPLAVLQPTVTATPATLEWEKQCSRDSAQAYLFWTLSFFLIDFY